MRAKNTGRPLRVIAAAAVFLWVAYAQAQSVPEGVEKHVRALAADSMGGRRAGTPQSGMAADYIIAQLREAGIEPFFGNGYIQDFEVRINRHILTAANLIGIIPGADPLLKDEYIVFSAHYDHLGTSGRQVFPGACDNASGVATIIEAGRILRQNQSRLGRSILIVAFDSEELGLNGSIHFLNERTVPAERIKALVNVDMVGETNTLTIAGIDTCEEGRQIACSLTPPDRLRVRYKNVKRSLITRTDAYPFAVKNIPTVMATTGSTSTYHTPYDTPGRLNMAALSRICLYMAALVEACSTAPRITRPEKLTIPTVSVFKDRIY